MVDNADGQMEADHYFEAQVCTMRYFQTCIASTSGISCLAADISPLEIYALGRLLEFTLVMIVRDALQGLTLESSARLIDDAWCE